MVLCLLSLSVFSQTDLPGTWHTGDQNTIVKIEIQNSIYTGKIVSSDNPKAKLGTLIVKDVKATKNGWKAKFYSPRRKDWYVAKMHKIKNKLVISFSVGLFSKTIEWTKVDG